MKKVILVLLVALISVSLCFAQGGNEKGATATAGKIEYKDQVVIGSQSKTTTTNPTAQSNVAHGIMFNLTHNSLVGYNETTGELVPELATSWEVAQDLKTWSFTLRDDVLFHNGEKFTAEDVAYTVEYGRNASNGTIKNTYNSIEKVNVIDATHVQIVLKNPNQDFLYTFSGASYGMLNKKAIDANAQDGPGIGTGAYKNVEFVVGDHTLLERNDSYWGELPPTKSLLFRLISEGTSRLAALESYEIDVCQAPNNTELDIIKANKELKLETYQATALTYLAFNTEDPVLADPNLRLAIAYALNVQDIIDGAASGFATVADGMWGSFEFGYFNDWASVGQTKYETNLAKAKEYLAKSNSPNGATIKFTTSTTWRVNALQIIQDQLKALNIKVEIDEVDAAGLTQKTKDGSYQVVMYSVTFTNAGSDAARIYIPGNSANHARYNNPKIVQLFEQAAAERDQAKRKEMYKEIQVIVHAECPYMALYYANSGAAYSAKLEGAIFNKSGAHDYTYVKAAK